MIESGRSPIQKSVSSYKICSVWIVLGICTSLVMIAWLCPKAEELESDPDYSLILKGFSEPVECYEIAPLPRQRTVEPVGPAVEDFVDVRAIPAR